jgi:hypothetical protein
MVTPAGTNQIPALTINSACRRIFLCMLIWDVLLWNTTLNTNVPLEANNEIIYGLVLTTLPPTDFSSIMQSIAPPGPAIGSQLIYHRIGQYFYNDIRFDNQLAIAFDFINLSVNNGYNISAHLHVETIE